MDAWLARSAAWQTDARLSYSPKSQGKSFLMTTKLVAYLKNSFATLPSPAAFDAANPPFDAAKTREWIGFAEGFTTGGLQGDDARAAFAKATWGNYDKSAPREQIRPVRVRGDGRNQGPGRRLRRVLMTRIRRRREFRNAVITRLL